MDLTNVTKAFIHSANNKKNGQVGVVQLKNSYAEITQKQLKKGIIKGNKELEKLSNLNKNFYHEIQKNKK